MTPVDVPRSARRPRPSAHPASAIDPALDTASAMLVDAVRHIVHALRGTSRAVEQRLGVHGAELLVLRKLADASAASLGELATRTQTDPSTASVVVRGLVERGLVTRSVASDDRRRTPIAITPAGCRVLHDAPEPAHTRVARAAAPLGPEEVHVLAVELAALAERLTAVRGGAAEPDEEDADTRFGT